MGTRRENTNQNVHMLSELIAINDTKAWIQQLHVPLGEIIQRELGKSSPSAYQSLSQKAYLMAKWCSPGYLANVDRKVFHMLDWNLRLPCGYAKITQGMLPSDYGFIINIIKELRIQIDFLLFDMDYTSNCLFSSYLKMCVSKNLPADINCTNNLVYCGHRKPWVISLDYSQAAMLLRQVNVLKECNLIFTYTSIGVDAFDVYRRNEHFSVIPDLDNSLLLSYDSFDRYPRRWLLVLKYGNRFNFTSIEICCYAAMAEIFDGFQNKHLLLNSQKLYNSKKRLNVTSVFHVSTVYYYPDNHDDKIHSGKQHLFILNYTIDPVHITYLQVDQIRRVNNNGGLLQVSLGINISSGGFPNISFDIRRFGDWNEDQCSFGGFILRHHINTTMLKATIDQGPFCASIGPSAPFVGTHGPKHIVLGMFQYVLIIYAFGPWYELDIDVTMSRSECEGLFEPLNMCSVTVPEQNIFENTRHFDGRNFRLLCVASKYTQGTQQRTAIKLTVLSLTKCVVFQSIASHQGTTEMYRFQARIDIDIDVTVGPMYSKPHNHDAGIHSTIAVGTMNNGTTEVYIDKSFQTRHREVSIVTFNLISYRQTLGLYVWFYMTSLTDDINVSSCDAMGSKADNATFVQEASKGGFKKILISNLCGTLYYTQHAEYLLKFHFASMKESSSEIVRKESFMYVHFKIRCPKETYNILTLVGVMSHAVSCISKQLMINEHYLPLHFLIANKINCSFTMEYRIRFFNNYVQFIHYLQFSKLLVSLHL